ncbi:MAG: HTH domain-containing protein, partial [Erysipelotrichaceae bacterium]|nr:HTH domain-containing protein [Erysipelotrichaceae bacterium]
MTKASKPVTAEQLADLSRSSIRTIKSDVNLLREQLEKEEIATIDSFKAKGYMINPIHEWTYTKFLMNLEAMMRVFYNRSIEETNRRMYIVQRIL